MAFSQCAGCKSNHSYTKRSTNNASSSCIFIPDAGDNSRNIRVLRPNVRHHLHHAPEHRSRPPFNEKRCYPCDRPLRLEDIGGVGQDGGERGYGEGARCVGICEAMMGMLVKALNWVETSLQDSYDVVYQRRPALD
jgi:hypothetical protein